MAKYKGKRIRSNREDDDLEHSYRTMAGSRKKQSNVGPVLICVAVLIVLILLLVGLSRMLMKEPAGNSGRLGNITAAGVNLQGKTPAEATEALRQATQNTYPVNSMKIQVLDTTVELSPASTGASLDIDAVVEAASDYTSSYAQIMDILPYLSLDTSVIKEAVEQLNQQYNVAVNQTSYIVEGQRPEEGSDAPAGQTLTITVGTPGYALNADALYDQIMLAYNNNTFLVQADCFVQEPEALDLETIYQAYYIAPVNATENPDTHEITEGVYGYGFDLEAARDILENARYGEVVTISIGRLAPEITVETLENARFQDVLASHNAPFDPEDTDVAANLRLACEAIDGIVLQPGESFSYNEALGERTEAKGYRPGPTFINGQTVYTIGGGICEVASALYYCSLLADMQIIERAPHMYAPSYVPLGMDSTIYWGAYDYQFRNNSDHPIRIEAGISNDNVVIRLMGTDNKNYYVKMEYVIIRTYDYKTTYRDMDADNADGYKDGDEIISPYTGYYVDTYRCKYDKQTNELISRAYETSSDYDHRDAVICRIKEETPTETTVPPNISTGGGVSEDPGDTP